MYNDEKLILTKRFQTTMIGALFEFEKMFGGLWGCHKHDDDLTNNELDILDKWNFVRNQILNNGNNQLRKAISDIDKIRGSDTKYNYNFYNKKRKDNYED
jgi:hypothetical protein